MDDPFHFTQSELISVHYAIHDWRGKLEITLKRTRMPPTIRAHYEHLLAEATRIEQRLNNELGPITINPNTIANCKD